MQLSMNKESQKGTMFYSSPIQNIPVAVFPRSSSPIPSPTPPLSLREGHPWEGDRIDFALWVGEDGSRKKQVSGMEGRRY